MYFACGRCTQVFVNIALYKKNYLLHHTIHSEYSTLHHAHVFKTSFFPSTINIWNNLQPVITNSTTIPQLRQAPQSTQTSGRRGATCSAGAEWTSHAYQHHLLHILCIQPNNSPHQHPLGVGLHAQLGLSGHLTLTSIISYTYYVYNQIAVHTNIR